ncbi:MAG: T9SS type A sorting domain-containing protein [Candidatus Kapabacteria bacterium]|nr:T9SS type A sorting domain-containing protein [Candidatus Kapabacteria bacterium]
MSKLFTILMLVIFSVSTLSAEPKTVEIALGAGSVNDVYYSLFDNAIVGEIPANDWDLAFEMEGSNAGIFVNEMKGVKLYEVPGMKQEQWSAPIDTTGYYAVEPLHNSVQTWNIGAFNKYMDGFQTSGDFGWGFYNMGQAILGTTVYVIVFQDGSAKRIMIELLTAGEYTFTYADLDGSNEITAYVEKQHYNDRNFSYYSFSDEEFTDREPPSSSWNLLFGRYMFPIDMGGSVMYYGVTGVRTNIGIKTAIVEGYPVENMIKPESEDEYSYMLSTIGHQWKTIQGDIVEELAYYVMLQDGLIFKLFFTAYDGLAGGNIEFTIEDVTTSVDEFDNNSRASFAVYPNVINRGDNCTIIYNTSNLDSKISFAMYDITGNLIETYSGENSDNLSQKSISTSGLAAGTYVVVMNVGENVSSQKIIVK